MRRLLGRRRGEEPPPALPGEPPACPRAARPGALPDDAEELWLRLAERFPETGVWPLLVPPDEHEWHFDVRPDWQSAAERDAEALIREWWQAHAADDDGRAEPLGEFPGLGRGGERAEAAEDATALLGPDAGALGLAAVTRPADVLAAIGWTGAINYGTDTGWQAAILRSWEERYDAILIGLGFDGVHLAVRRPPAGEDAVRCAAEHYAFCPDVVDQGAGTLAALAETLEDLSIWTFWWD